MLTIPQQAGADGRLFGSVTAQDIASAIREARGLRIDKRGVHLPEPIKNVGTYMVVVDVVEGVTATSRPWSSRRNSAPAALGPTLRVPATCEHVFVAIEILPLSGEAVRAASGGDLDSARRWP